MLQIRRGPESSGNGEERRGEGSAMANIIINQRRSDVNVKLPEPIWSCITRPGGRRVVGGGRRHD